MVYDLGGHVTQAFQFRPIRCDVRNEGAARQREPRFLQVKLMMVSFISRIVNSPSQERQSPAADYAGSKTIPARYSGANLTPPGIIRFPA